MKECPKINFENKNAQERKGMLSGIKRFIAEKGISALEKDGMQRLFNQLDSGEMGEMISSVVEIYDLGEGWIEKEKSKQIRTSEGELKTETISVRALEETNEKMVRLPGNKPYPVKINDQPIRYEKDFGEFVLRYNFIKKDGSIEGMTKVAPLSILDFMHENIEEEKDNQVEEKYENPYLKKAA